MSDLLELVTEVEADVHKLGWDMPAHVFVLCEDEEKGLCFKILNLPLFLFNDVMECMEALASRGMRLGDTALGILLVNEAWGVTLDPSAFHEDGTYDGPKPSESPDRIEVRMSTLLTRDGRMICAQHERETDKFEIQEADEEYKGMQYKARVPYLMHILLTGEEPPE